jgi:carotenoid 1,2-hydratase
MTERSAPAVRRSPSTLVVGPSALHWDAGVLTIDVDEVSFPAPARVRGRIRVHASASPGVMLPLDGDGRHRWSPLAPCARVEVALARPDLRWQGEAYLDTNAGDAPLEDAFSQWHWSRATAAGRTTIYYDLTPRAGPRVAHALQIDATGAVKTFVAPPAATLPGTGWRIARTTRAPASALSRVLRTLEDTPFYARSLLALPLAGGTATAVHESLSLDRFRTRWVQALLPFRMPRRSR